MDKRRLIFLCIFSISLFMLLDAWHKFNLPKEDASVATTSEATGDPSVPVPSLPAPSSGIPAPTAPETSPAPTVEVAVAKGETIEIRTDLFVAQISAQGGDLIGLELNSYKATEDKSKPFMLFDTAHQYAAQSGLIGENLPNHKTVFSIAPGKRELAAGDDVLELRLEAPDADGIKVTKIYTFKRGSYLIDVRHEIDNGSANRVAAYAYYHLQRDTVAPAGGSRMVSTFTGPALYTEQSKYQKIDFEDIEKGKAKFEKKADNGWVAMVQHYFVSAWIPQPGLQREFYVRKLDGGANSMVDAGVIVPVPEVAPGTKTSFSASLYAGPQLQSVLDKLSQPVSDGGIGAEGLPLVVDYGWLTILSAPIFWLLEAIYKVVGNWGWAIILLTILIKALFYPLSAASYKSMAKMRTVAPQLQALKARCGDDRQKLNMEMMALYKSEKINPLGGCLPILIQIPVFIALYWALLGAVEMRNAPWALWIQDLSAQDPYYILPVIMMATMLIQTKLNPKPPDPIQAKITMIMPFAFGIMFFFFPAGLVLYWVVNNVLSIAQQWQITRMVERGSKAANDAKL